MAYSFPDEETLAKYLAILDWVLIDARYMGHESPDKLEALIDAAHNIPHLLCRWPEAKESLIIESLRGYEEQYCSGGARYTGILDTGPSDKFRMGLWHNWNEDIGKH